MMLTALRHAGRVLRGAAIVVALAAAAFLVVPRLLGWQVVTVLSGSMAPTYPVDTALIVRPVDPADVRAGDVIAFVVEADRPMVTHRVVAVDASGGRLRFTTKGDANEDADSVPVNADAVRGRVVLGVPLLGMFVRFVRAPLGFGLLVVLPGGLLIGEELLGVRRDRRTRDQRSAVTPPPAAPTDRDTSEEFEFWTTIADEERYYAELDREVRAWCAAEC